MTSEQRGFERHFAIDGTVRHIARRLPVLRNYERRIAELRAQRAQLESQTAQQGERLAVLEALVAELTPPPLQKWDVVDTLRTLTGARTYTQILTPTTSPEMPNRPELLRFARATTYQYASERQRQDMAEAAGLPTLDELSVLLADAPKADLVFVDPWHTYEASLRTLELALDLVADGGVLVSHDCLPSDVQSVTADVIDPLFWCGETWRAFVDLTRQLPDGSRSFVIDEDAGIGVICPGPGKRRAAGGPSPIPEDLDAVPAWEWLIAHLHSVMDVVTAHQWLTDPARVLRGE